MMKRFTRSEAFLTAAGSLAAGYIRLVAKSSRIIREPDGQEAELLAEAPFIAAMWHGQFLMIPAMSPKGLDVKCMVARHGDGEIVGRALRSFGLDLIRGAGAGKRRKDRGGAHALRAALTTLAEGTTVAMTADIPPGPARQAGMGIVTLARLSGRPIVPVAIATSRFATVNTWSRFTLNLPFSKIAVISGPKIEVARDAGETELEAARAAVEDGLNLATRRAYELAGRDAAAATPVSAGGSVAPGLSLRAYRTISRAIHPAAGMFLRRRSQRGKEVPERLNERMGIASLSRPAGTLLWFHAASVGETNVVLPLIEALRKERPDLGILLTTVTVTSARIAAARLPSGAVHQFVPLDSPAFVQRFLDHWRPNMGLFTESEIWPNLILDADRRRIPLALLNARMSDRSFKRWLKMPGVSRPLFSRFAVVLAQSDGLAKRLATLGARKVISAGNIKFDSPPPPVDPAELQRFKAMVAGRPIFLAASTHPGEDEIVAEAHKALSASYPGLLTVIVPRHPERGADIAAMLEAQGLAAARRSQGAALGAETAIYVGDTVGDLGMFYAVAPIAFIGGSLVPHGGQNPIEAVKLGAGVVTGPHWHNFPEVYQALAEQGGCRFVTSQEDLIHTARALLDDRASLDLMRARAERTVSELSGALGRTLEALEPFLPPKRPTVAAYAS
ncbi:MULTISPECIES: glycosyltransferase N-terminal domain-containing protein [Rhodomicrobium]|uniref:glycosyltransferase N-terminal domain-containing protein n=1 Tax=Rhodomicrobium TaxID=1068 RepID=UPI001FD8DCB0|nr:MULTISPECIES: glycosyltransferase N-terminal domain-containing protein [Rhodomicrobium]